MMQRLKIMRDAMFNKREEKRKEKKLERDKKLEREELKRQANMKLKKKRSYALKGAAEKGREIVRNGPVVCRVFWENEIFGVFVSFFTRSSFN